MTRNESTRQSRTLARLYASVRVLVALLLVVGLLTAQAGSVAATGGASSDTTEGNGILPDGCSFADLLLDWLGIVDNGCVNALENGMGGISP